MARNGREGEKEIENWKANFRQPRAMQKVGMGRQGEAGKKLISRLWTGILCLLFRLSEAKICALQAKRSCLHLFGSRNMWTEKALIEFERCNWALCVKKGPDKPGL